MTNPTAEAIAQAFTEQAFQPAFLSSTGPFIRSVMGRAREIDASRAEQAGGVSAEAMDSLRNHQQQLDTDGILVGVSRQALDELLATLAKPEHGEAQQPGNFVSKWSEAIRKMPLRGQHPQRPEGGEWVLMRKEPTVETLTAMSHALGINPLADGSDSDYPITGKQSTVRQCYDAMLAAAPAPPAVGEGDAWRYTKPRGIWIAGAPDEADLRIASENGYEIETRANTAPPSRYCDACEQVVSEPCSSADCATPENLRATSREVGDAVLRYSCVGYDSAPDEEGGGPIMQADNNGAWVKFEDLSATPTQPPVQEARDGVVRVQTFSVPQGLHPETSNLVRRFSEALAEKLAAAERKYGYSNGWASDDWMGECRAKLREHIEKGDPRDVAAYCAFLWYHGESTAGQPTQQADGRVVAWMKVWPDGHLTFSSCRADFAVTDNLTPLYAAHPPHGLVVDEATVERAVAAFESSKRTNVFGKMHAALLAAIGEVKP